jgi:hypothetical protein
MEERESFVCILLNNKAEGKNTQGRLQAESERQATYDVQRDESYGRNHRPNRDLSEAAF